MHMKIHNHPYNLSILNYRKCLNMMSNSYKNNSIKHEHFHTMWLFQFHILLFQSHKTCKHIRKTYTISNNSNRNLQNFIKIITKYMKKYRKKLKYLKTWYMIHIKTLENAFIWEYLNMHAIFYQNYETHTSQLITYSQNVSLLCNQFVITSALGFLL